MRKKIPYFPIFQIVEANPNLFVLVLCIYSETTFKLNPEKRLAVYVVSNKVGSLPIIAKSKGNVAIVRQNTRYLLEVEILLLASI